MMHIIRLKSLTNFIINNLLLLSGIATIFSGLAIQIGFHMKGLDHENIFWGADYFTWSSVHKIVVIFFTILAIYHIFNHLQWYKTVFTKKLVSKNRKVIILSVLFILTALTGFIPWYIDLSGNSESSRHIFIEIHDKFTLFLIIYFILHVIRKIKWFSFTFKKFKSNI